MTQAAVDRLMQLLRQGHGMASACLECGIGYSTVMDRYRKDPQFREDVKVARQVANDKVEAQLYEMAQDGNLAAIKFVLTNRRSKRWSEKHEVVGGGSRITVNVANIARQIAENPDAARHAIEAANRVREPKLLTILPPAQPMPQAEGASG